MDVAARLLDDRDPLRQMLQAARAWGVSPRRFLGWEPARITVYERNNAGQVVRATVTQEPEWSEEDQDMALALANYEADLCGGCGHPLWETTQPDNEDRYRARAAIRCHRCTASLQAQESYETSPHPGALLIPIELIKPV